MRARIFAALLLLTATGCRHEIETYSSEPLSGYLPLAVGKYIIYELDSTVFTNFGRNIEVHRYQEKNVVDAPFTDNLGRAGFRLIRYVRDSAGTQPWVNTGTYYITPTEKTIEVVENNQRVVRLIQPIREGTTWHGNQYLPFDLYSPKFEFDNDDNMDKWEFIYASTTDTFSYKQQNLTGVLKVRHIDEREVVDTVDVAGNKAEIPKNSSGVWLRGTATDTIRINAGKPDLGNERLTIYNQTNQYASLNNIKIPSRLALSFEFSNEQWYYPNVLMVVNNRTAVPRDVFTATISGVATDSIKVDVSQIDTSLTKRIDIYNKSNYDAYCSFNALLKSVKIPPGFGRSYELYNGEWRLFENRNTLLDQDPFITDLPYGDISYSVDKYAKGIGLVYQELILWQFQPNLSGPSAYTVGFGVKRTLLEHN